MELKDMSAKYGIAFSADMKRYPGKLWTVTAQNCNKPGLHTQKIAVAVDREDLHQILILTLNIYFSLSRFHSLLRRIAAETSFRPEVKSPYHVWTKAPSGLVVSPKAIRFSVNMALMGVFTYKRNAWQTQVKGSHTRTLYFIGQKWKLIKLLCLVNGVFQSFRQRLEKKKNVCPLLLLQKKKDEAYGNGFHINLRGEKTQLNKFQC